MKRGGITTFCAFGILFSFSCNHLPSRSDKNSLSKDQVLEIAKDYVAEKADLGSQAAFGNPKRRIESDTWSVPVWRHPLAPDGLNEIEINAEGKVVSFRSVFSSRDSY